MEPLFNVRSRSGIYIGPVKDILSGVLPEGRVVVVSDATIDRLYHPLLEKYDTVLIGLGESVKTLQTVETIYRRFIELGVDRSTFVLAVGGGIVTDVAGFAASTYMRGLKFGFVSTTLLGQVDASVGGKNGVNVDGYKNMAGTFTQPQFVICDPGLLRTLPDREFRAGLAEVVKAAIIADADLFGRIENTTFEALRTDTDLLTDAVSAAIRVKADIVERDEHESGDRRKLNLGHTLAHAIEKCSNRMNHGEAVAVGTALIAGAAVKLGVLSEADRDRIVHVLMQLGFDLTPPVDVKRLLKEVGKMSKPILLKRGLANTIDELLMSAEYIMASGNENVILCERGIRTFETRTRNTLDLSAVPVLKKLTHLPIVVDPSHAMGYAHLVKPMAMAATVAGADGLMIEVHNNPAKALCDGPQSLTPDQFDDVAKQVFQLRPFACKYDY